MKDAENFSDILNNKHFLRYATILAISMSPAWNMRHRGFPTVRSTLDTMARLLRGGETFDKDAFVEKWVMLFADLAMQDGKLQVYTDDVEWFFDVVLGTDAKVTLSMLFACACTRQTYLSTEQASAASGIPESTLRRKALTGEIPGARKIGEKTWLFSVLALQSVGIDVKMPLIEIIEGQEESELE